MKEHETMQKRSTLDLSRLEPPERRKRHFPLKELLSIITGIFFAYSIQLVIIGIIWLSSIRVAPFTSSDFIPDIRLMAIVSPIASWIFFGVYRVSWHRIWALINISILSFSISLVSIFVIAIEVGKIYLCYQPSFEMGASLLAFVITYIIFKFFRWRV